MQSIQYSKIIKEEGKVITFLRKLLDKNKISEELHDKLKPRGSYAPRLSWFGEDSQA